MVKHEFSTLQLAAVHTEQFQKNKQVYLDFHIKM